MAKNNTSKNGNKQAHISVQLLVVLIPAVIIAITFVAVTLSLQAKGIHVNCPL